MDAIEIKEIRRTNFFNWKVSKAKFTVWNTYSSERALAKFSSSSDVKHQKCQKELEIIYVSKKLTEEGLGSTTSLTKTQQSEVRKKNEKMVTSQSEKWKVLERMAHQGNKEKWRDWTRKASGYFNEITRKIIYRNFWKRGGSELEYFKRSPNRLTRIQRMYDKRTFVLSSTLFMFFIQTLSTSG